MAIPGLRIIDAPAPLEEPDEMPTNGLGADAQQRRRLLAGSIAARAEHLKRHVLSLHTHEKRTFPFPSSSRGYPRN